MARVTLKSQAIIIAQLEAQVAELTTQVGVLMNQLQAAQAQDIPQHFQESYAALVDERNELIAENQRLTESCVAHKRCDALEAIVSTKPAPQPQHQSAASKPLPSSSLVESAAVIEITPEDRRIWAAFQALPREKRQSYYEFAHTTVGHLGIHNIVAVREAYLAKQAV